MSYSLLTDRQKDEQRRLSNRIQLASFGYGTLISASRTIFLTLADTMILIRIWGLHSMLYVYTYCKRLWQSFYGCLLPGRPSALGILLQTHNMLVKLFPAEQQRVRQHTVRSGGNNAHESGL